MFEGFERRRGQGRASRVLYIATLQMIALLYPRHAVGQDRERSLTVKDVIESTRVLRPYGADAVSLSPDGKRYLVVFQKGDLRRNGSWIELFSGGTGSLKSASERAVMVRLFTSSKASTDELIKNVRWLADNRRVAFLWDDGQRMARVVSVDLRTRRIQTLAESRTPIVQYDISADGETIVFTAQAPDDSARESRERQEGFAVTDQSIWSLLAGRVDGWTPTSRYDTFVLNRRRRLLYKVRETARSWSTPPELLKLSPDGRYAVTVRAAGVVPADWDNYTNHLFRDSYLPAARRNPNGPYWVRQYVVIDVRSGTTHPLWNAPENPSANLLWSPDSRTIVVGPTFLPVSVADDLGLSGQALAEVDAATGQYRSVPVPPTAIESQYRPKHWIAGNVLEIVNDNAPEEHRIPLWFRKLDGEWKPVKAEDAENPPGPRVRVEVREDPNTPPSLYAIDQTTGSRRLIRDLNPQLQQLALGRVEPVQWKGTDGRKWTGLLYYPVHYQAGKRFPLVIQTHGYLPTQFSLEGVFPTAFAAQPLANLGIAVLQLGIPDPGGEPYAVSPREPEVYAAGFEGAIDHFVASGLAERSRIGIVGYSRTGWIVEYTLTHSRCRFAAAEVADNFDGSYLQYLLAENGSKAESEADNGARPFGKGLETWIRSAPGFNADKVNTPLRMEIDMGPIERILNAWEMFSNLRALGKPVELFVIPDIQHGAHILQNPAQRLASEGGTIDWFCFWLKGQEDSDPAKAGQYERWRGLRTLGKSASSEP